VLSLRRPDDAILRQPGVRSDTNPLRAAHPFPTRIVTPRLSIAAKAIRNRFRTPEFGSAIPVAASIRTAITRIGGGSRP
jgi:hypothetical protein